MKIRYMSDLHLEFNEIDFINSEDFFDFDILVLAGDIFVFNNTASRKKFLVFLNQLHQMGKPMVFVCGNHEFYNSNISRTVLSLKKLNSVFSNFYFLNNSYVEIEGIRFIGSTMWSDLEYAKSPNDILEMMLYLNDFNYIRIGKKEEKLNLQYVEKMAKKTKLYIEKNLDYYRPNVVVTHFGPSILSYNDSVPEEISPYYSSNCEDIMKKHEEITIWIHGHTHKTFDYFIHKTRVLSNPRGYPEKDKNNKIIAYNNKNFDPYIYVKI